MPMKALTFAMSGEPEAEPIAMAAMAKTSAAAAQALRRSEFFIDAVCGNLRTRKFPLLCKPVRVTCKEKGAGLLIVQVTEGIYRQRLPKCKRARAKSQ